MGTVFPRTCTGETATVWSLRAARMASGFICSVQGSQSTSTGMPPACTMGQKVVDQLTAGTITSEPGKNGRFLSDRGAAWLAIEKKARRLAEDPEFTKTASS